MHFTRRHFGLVIFAAFGVCIATVTPSQESGSAPARLAKQPVPAEVQQRKSYLLRYKSADEAARVLRPLFHNSSDVSLQIDSKRSTLLLEGPDWAHECVRQVLETLDRPSSRRATASLPSRLMIYRCPIEDRESVESQIRRQFSDEQVAISSHPQEGLLFVRADESIHRQLGSWLAPVDENQQSPQFSRNAIDSQDPPHSRNTIEQQRSTLRRLPDTSRGPEGGGPTTERKHLSLKSVSLTTVRRELLQVLEGRIHEPTNSELITVQTASGMAQIRLDSRHEECTVDGPLVVVEQLARLIDAIARNTDSADGLRQQVVPLHRHTQPRLKEVLGPFPGSSLEKPQRQGSHTTARGAGIRPVTFQQAVDGPADSGLENPSAENDDQQPNRDRRAGTAQLTQFEGVEIEMLPDLDAIILRGRDQELRQLTEIIQQLEKISRETQAAIEVVPLQYASSQRIASVIQQTQTHLLGSRQGRANVTALVKPNALLIIGWGEAVTALTELISKLDRPVDSDTQFDVIRLQHATATAIQQTLQGFFSGRTGLGPVIQSTIDARTNSLIVHAAPRDMAEVRQLLERLDVPQGATVQRARVFPIEHSLAADVAQTLQQAIQPATSAGRSAALELMMENGEGLVASGILENTQITVNSRNNSLIIAAPAGNFALIESLIRQLDTPGIVAKIKIFPIQHGDAASLVETLRALLPSQSGANQSLQLSSAPGESSLAPLRFTVDARSNSLIATGSEGDLKIVDALVLRLDENDSMQRRSIVYQLKNSAAVDVALTVNEFLRSNRQVEFSGPGRINPFQQLEKEVIVVPEPVANKLILSATPRYFDEINKLIEKLDQQPPQVMIQVLIAEVAIGDAEEFGVELGIQDSVLFDRSLLGNLVSTTNTNQTSTPAGILTQTQQTVIAASNQPGFDFNNTRPLGNSGSSKSLDTANTVGGQGLSNFDVGRGSAELGFGGLVLSASSQNLSVLMRALQESRRLEVLSRPQVLTLDNQPAFIQVGQRVPRIIGSIVNQAGQQNNVTLENVGLILGVTPRISPEGNVVMEIDAEKSELGPEIEGIPVSVSTNGTIIRSPRINTTTAQATVSAASGETIILGGLITKSTRELHRKVPYLGDVPMLGNLFRYDSRQQRRTELLIVLTPHVVRSPDDLQRLKQTELARMSWCAADVFDLHGDLGVGPHSSELFPYDDNSETIYPDIDPRGRSRSRSRPSDPASNYQPGALLTPPEQSLSEMPDNGSRVVPASRWQNEASNDRAPLQNRGAVR